MPAVADLPGIDNWVFAQGHRGKWSSMRVAARPPVAALLVPDQRDALAAAWAHLQMGGVETLIADERRVDRPLRAALIADGFQVIDGSAGVADTVPRDPIAGRLWLLTSGSTGRPKRVAHTFASLAAGANAAAGQPHRRWLMGYAAGTYAWWQMTTLSLLQPGQDLVALEPAERAIWPEIAEREGITAVSGTPTFWWRAVLHHWERLCRLRIEQVSLGGEPVEQSLLDRLHEALPRARIWWAYASTEFGTSIVVRDRRAGFPIEWLQQHVPGRPALRVSQGELWLEAPAGSGTFQRTGDRASVVGDRVLLTGRVSADEINVGGAKIAASTIRHVLSQHPAVAWVRASARKAPIIGQAPVVDVVLQSPIAAGELRRWCAERLPDYGVPRRFEILGEIPETLAGKSHV